MTTFDPLVHAYEIFRSATPVLRIDRLGKQGDRRWKRNVAKGARIGPWLQARYELLNSEIWNARQPCLYFVAGSDHSIRYVGISRNRLKDRWRLSPAFDADTGERLAENQLFHSQCWKAIELEASTDPHASFEVRCIQGSSLLALLPHIGPPLSGLAMLGDDHEGIVAAVERWICNNKNSYLARWNVSMTI